MLMPGLKPVALFVTLFTCLCACKKNTNTPLDPARFYVEYEVSYTSDGNTILKAHIRWGSPNMAVDFTPSAERTISFNGIPVNNGTEYTTLITGRADTGTFTYTDQTGTAYYTPLNALPARLIPDTFIAITRYTDNVFTWGTDTLLSGENLRLTIANTDTANGQQFTATAPATFVYLPQARLNQFKPGSNNASATLYNSRGYWHFAGAPAGGLVSISNAGVEKIISVR